MGAERLRPRWGAVKGSRGGTRSFAPEGSRLGGISVRRAHFWCQKNNALADVRGEGSRALQQSQFSLASDGGDPSAVEALAAFVRRHPRLLVLTGAGISTESGIPAYRDHSGAWTHSPPLQLQEFLGSEQGRRRYWGRSLVGWPRVAAARPNPGHRALARLEAAGHVELLVTQNVDGLHGRAGSRAVVDLHGRLDTVSCLDCGLRLPRGELQRSLATLNPELPALAAVAAPDGDASVRDQDWSALQIPACQGCGGILKPDVVFYGESVPAARVERALAALARADALLVAGSSLMVYSGFRFARAAAQQGKPLAAVNLGRTRADELLSLKLEAPCGELLPALASHLRLPAAESRSGLR